jgi:hypothetical protein
MYKKFFILYRLDLDIDNKTKGLRGSYGKENFGKQIW